MTEPDEVRVVFEINNIFRKQSRINNLKYVVLGLYSTATQWIILKRNLQKIYLFILDKGKHELFSKNQKDKRT